MSVDEKITSVGPAEFNKIIGRSRGRILDVRTREEFAGGHIAGAVNVDVERPGFMAEAAGVLNCGEPVYVYCRSGHRSMIAARLLAREGYRVVNLDGGIIAWTEAGLPVEKD